MTLNRVICCLILFISVTGCSPQSFDDVPEHIRKIENLKAYRQDINPVYRAKLIKEQAFGDTDNIYIQRFADFDVDDSGRVFIADNGENNIKIFKPDGKYLARLGRRGQGPGEFGGLSNLHVTSNYLFAHDPSQHRAIIFNTDSLLYAYSINLRDEREDRKKISYSFPNGFYVKNNETLLVKYTKAHHGEHNTNWDKVEVTEAYYIINSEGEITSDKFYEMRSSTRVIVPAGGYSVDRRTGLYARQLKALSADDHFYSSWSEDFLINVYDPDGKHSHSFYYPYERVSLTLESAKKAGIPEFILDGFQLMDLPKSWPVLNSILIDDEKQLWISSIVEDFEVYQWWILKETGELLARYTWPRNRQIEVVKNGKVYTRETDPETGLQQVVRYGFKLVER